MQHYVYCVENLINGKVYVGKHSTNNMNDGYMGSGKLLTKAIVKHGIENFRKHILQMFESSEEAFEFESKLVDENFISDENTYNLICGGEFRVCSLSASDAGKLGAIVNLANPEFRKRFIERTKRNTPDRNRRLWKEGVYTNKHMLGNKWFVGKRHTDITKEKIGKANSRHQSGEGNSQFGTVWVHNVALQLSKRVKIEDLDKALVEGWAKGRKIKW